MHSSSVLSSVDNAINLLIIGLCCVAFLHVFGCIRELPSRSRQNDFSIYYASAMLLREHRPVYTTELRPFAASLGLDSKFVNATDPPIRE